MIIAGFSAYSRVIDWARFAAIAKNVGAYFVVDAIQGLGPLALDVRSAHIDVLACGAQKWLLSPWGSGFVYVRRDLIAELDTHCVRPEFCYRHRWRVGDLVMWDNASAMHLAICDYALPERRLMHRTTVIGSQPF